MFAKHTMAYNIPKAFIQVIAAFFWLYPNLKKEPHNQIYLVNLFYYVDKLINTLGGGSYLVTVSARVGYNHSEHPKSKKWKYMNNLINATFYPLDGEGHCRQAYEWLSDHDKDKVLHGPIWALMILCFFVTLSCIPLYPLARIIGYYLKKTNKKLY